MPRFTTLCLLAVLTVGVPMAAQNVPAPVAAPPAAQPVVATPVAPAPPSGTTVAGCSDQAHANAAYERVFWAVTAALAVGTVLIIAALKKSPSWTLGDALGEERIPETTQTTTAGTTTTVTTPQPPIAGSASRLIAMFGLLVLACVILGIGYGIIYGLIAECRVPSLDGVGAYLAGGAALFAPYAVNQIREAFGTK